MSEAGKQADTFVSERSGETLRFGHVDERRGFELILTVIGRMTYVQDPDHAGRYEKEGLPRSVSFDSLAAPVLEKVRRVKDVTERAGVFRFHLPGRKPSDGRTTGLTAASGELVTRSGRVSVVTLRARVVELDLRTGKSKLGEATRQITRFAYPDLPVVTAPPADHVAPAATPSPT